MICSSRLSKQSVLDHILNLREMEKAEKEMYIMGCLTKKIDTTDTRKGERIRNSYS